MHLCEGVMAHIWMSDSDAPKGLQGCFIAVVCNTLQHTATHCNTLQHTATHYKVVRKSRHRCLACQFPPNEPYLLGSLAESDLQNNSDATYSAPCSVLQCVAVCCSVLHCVAACCSVLQYDAGKWLRNMLVAL